ncbi:MAG TPA: DUF5711 family protein [Ruminiclostridium sp.]|nr:DUF5711 family protein [Ruminiclostridium sp.]
MNTNPNPESNIVKFKKSGILSIIFFLLLLIAISSIAFIVYLKNAGYDFSSWSVQDAITFIKAKEKADKTSLKQISFSQDGSVDCKLYDNYTILLSQDSIKWYDRNDKLLQENALTLTKPVLRTSKKYMAVVDISGRDIYFYRGKKQLWTRKLDNQIINADINDDGYCTVVTQSKEFKSAVQIIDINGIDKYTKLCAQDIVLSAKSIHSGDDIIINKLTTDSVKTGTRLEFDNIYDEKPFATVNIADTIVPLVLTQGDNVVAVGQNVILYLNKQGKEVWRKNADSIFCVVPYISKYIIAAGKFTNEGGITKQQVIVLDKSGKEVYSFDQSENIVGMDMYGSRLLIRTQRSVYIYSLKGQKLGQYSARNELKDAYLVGDNEVSVVAGGSIETVKLNESTN